jgi:hypothetical protein
LAPDGRGLAARMRPHGSVFDVRDPDYGADDRSAISGQLGAIRSISGGGAVEWIAIGLYRHVHMTLPTELD